MLSSVPPSLLVTNPAHPIAFAALLPLPALLVLFSLLMLVTTSENFVLAPFAPFPTLYGAIPP